jgi:hypothetical protein
MPFGDDLSLSVVKRPDDISLSYTTGSLLWLLDFTSVCPAFYDPIAFLHGNTFRFQPSSTTALLVR